MEIYVRHVELLGFEKRFFPSQHYVSLNIFLLLLHHKNLLKNLKRIHEFMGDFFKESVKFKAGCVSVQVYLLMVKWSDLAEKLIYRTYPEIHTFHVRWQSNSSNRLNVRSV